MKRFKNGKSWLFIGIGLFLSITGVLAQQFWAYRTQTQTQVETLPSIAQTSEADAADDSKEAAADLMRIRQAHLKTPMKRCALEYELTSALYPNQSEKIEAIWTKLPKDMHLKVGNIEYFKVGQQLLYIDHDAKKMILEQTGKNQMPLDKLHQMTKWLEESGANPVVESVQGTIKRMDLDILNPQIENVQFWYDSTNYQIQKAQFLLTQLQEAAPDTLRVAFKQDLPLDAKFKLDLKPFIRISKKKIGVADAFKSYTLNVIP